MCGFFGVFGGACRDMAAEKARALTGALSHRGPDDYQTLAGDDFRLMFWRLSIVDAAGGRQPMASDHGAKILMFNGEVYNYRAIRAELQRAGRRFTTDSDTEVILSAYAEWGVPAFERLEGMFAICILDLTTRRVVLARDRLGVKPLYFHTGADGLVVASEQSVILSYLGGSPRLDRTAFASYFVFQTVIGTRTLFESVSKVKPGFALDFDLDSGRLVDAHRLRTRRHQPKARSYDEYREQVRDEVLTQVDLALDTDLPISFHLSGGIDSNLLVGLCRHRMPGRALTCVTSLVESPTDPEAPWIEAAATHHGANLAKVEVTAESFFRAMDDVIWSLGEPVGDPGVVPQFLVNARASTESKIVYSGQGFDELFFGYTRDLAAYALAVFGPGALDPNSEAYTRLHTNTRAFFADWNGFLGSLASKPVSPELALFRKLCRFDVFAPPESMAPESVEPLLALALDEFCRIQSETASTHDFMLEAETSIQLPSLLHMEDRASMRYSLETRVPFCTASILDLAGQAELEWKFTDGQPKGLLRDVFRDVLPPPVLERRAKIGRPIPFRRWLMEDSGRPYLEDARSKRDVFRELTGTDYVAYALEHANPYDRSAWAVVSVARWIDLHNVRV